MKLKKLFGKSKQNGAAIKNQTLDKKQLAQVIGGAETTLTTTSETVAHELTHVVQQGK